MSDDSKKKQIRIKKTKNGGSKKKQNRDQKKNRRGRKAKEKRVESFSWRGVGGRAQRLPPWRSKLGRSKKRKETEDCTDVLDE